MTSLLEYLDARIAEYRNRLLEGEDDSMRCVVVINELEQVRQKVIEIYRAIYKNIEGDECAELCTYENGFYNGGDMALKLIGEPKEDKQ